MAAKKEMEIIESMSVEERRRINNENHAKWLNEKVEVAIPIGDHKTGDSTTVSCDGNLYQIQYGKTVKVPRKIAEIIKRSIAQEEKAAELSERLSGSAAELGAY